MSSSKTPHLQEAALIHSHLALHALHGLLNALQATEAIWLGSLSHKHTTSRAEDNRHLVSAEEETA